VSEQMLTTEFKEWREAELAEREKRRADIRAHNAALPEYHDPNDELFYPMLPEAIRPMKMVKFGPIVCGWCLMTNDEDNGGCNGTFHAKPGSEV